MWNMADISKVSRRKHELLGGITNTISVNKKLWQHTHVPLSNIELALDHHTEDEAGLTLRFDSFYIGIHICCVVS
jgi:hypothetical protein